MRGKVTIEIADFDSEKDHPCVCGEKFSLAETCLQIMTSPLRMRGKVEPCLSKSIAARITPAYAGKSFQKAYIMALFGDHPCVCGEKLFFDIRNSLMIGSPLRMRGKVKIILSRSPIVGITPAYAGKSISG